MSNNIIHVKNITQAHELLGLPKPKHPQVSVFRHKDLRLLRDLSEVRFTMDLYMISMKDQLAGEFGYGRQTYDFQEGTMVFIAPNQVFSGNSDFDESSDDWMVLFDADFIRTSELGRSINNYHFFSYEANEALHLSEDEKAEITNLVIRIEKEYQQNIDKHTQEIILINLESILKYCQRFYDRQFITRNNFNQNFIVAFENFLKQRFAGNTLETGIPTVAECGRALNMSAHYLSDLLKSETGKSAKEHIDLHLVNKAKNMLQTTQQSISEIAYDLGFDYPNHFSKFFKSKTGLSPSEFKSMN